MNFTQAILNNLLISDDSRLTILVTDNSGSELIDFLKQSSHRFIKYEDLYYGSEIPNLVLCNNKIDYYHMCKELSITYHIPSVVVDHVVKNDIYDNEKLKFLDNLPCSFKVAKNISVYKSWNSIHDKILSYSNTDDLDNWLKFLLQAAKKEFIL